MIICPDCNHENLEGNDQCEACGQSLADQSVRMHISSVELGLAGDRVSVLNPRVPSAIASDTPVGEALQKMVANRVGCMLVVDNERLVGIFSERDALFKLNVDAVKLADRPVSEFMTTNPETLRENHHIAFAIHKMDLGGYRHLPVLSKGKLTGVISVRDILNYLTKRMRGRSA